MDKFPGFTSAETFAQFPDSLIPLMKDMEDVAELKVTVYALWRIDHMEGNFRALRESDFEPGTLGLDADAVRRGLDKALERGSLLQVRQDAEFFYFLNSPRGRLTAEALQKGHWNGSAAVFSSPSIRSNIFKLYEENIGALTPLISDMLREAEREYPAEWFEEAFAAAAGRNVRNWKYVEAILKRWKENGKDERKDQSNPDKPAERYTDSEFSEFLHRD